MKLSEILYFDINKTFIKYSISVTFLLIGFVYTIPWYIYIIPFLSDLYTNKWGDHSRVPLLYWFTFIILPACQLIIFYILAISIYCERLNYYYVYIIPLLNLIISICIMISDIIEVGGTFHFDGYWVLKDIPQFVLFCIMIILLGITLGIYKIIINYRIKQNEIN